VIYLLVFGSGLAASFHCIGMCGGFPLALNGGRPRANLARQLLYNLGRLNTLAVIGALSGAAGAAIVASGPMQLLAQTLAVVAAGFMFLVGLEILGLPLGMTARGALLVSWVLRRLLGDVVGSRSAAAPLALGIFNAFLPCQLIYAFAARAASTASPVEGACTMIAFGLGTVPALLAVGTVGAVFRPTVRARLSRLSGILVLLFAVLTVVRGFDLGLPLAHRH
jgi:sulfite exporter TauE/SafE